MELSLTTVTAVIKRRETWRKTSDIHVDTTIFVTSVKKEFRSRKTCFHGLDLGQVHLQTPLTPSYVTMVSYLQFIVFRNTFSPNLGLSSVTLDWKIRDPKTRVLLILDIL